MRLLQVSLVAIALIVLVQWPFAVHADTAHIPLISMTPRARATEIGLVTHIVDGDTFDLVLEDDSVARVRPLCWDAPENTWGKDECMADEAEERLDELIMGQIVILTMDVRNDNGDGRLLRHVYLEDGTWIGATMVREGYARTREYEPDTRLCPYLWDYQAEAVAAGAGGWSECDWSE